jgi:hypothetical protein
MECGIETAIYNSYHLVGGVTPPRGTDEHGISSPSSYGPLTLKPFSRTMASPAKTAQISCWYAAPTQRFTKLVSDGQQHCFIPMIYDTYMILDTNRQTMRTIWKVFPIKEGPYTTT